MESHFVLFPLPVMMTGNGEAFEAPGKRIF